MKNLPRFLVLVLLIGLTTHLTAAANPPDITLNPTLMTYPDDLP